MNVGILGSGTAGQALASGFVSRGHKAMMGTRDPSSEKVASWVTRTGPGASAGTFAETATFGELVVIAGSWDGAENMIKLAGPASFKGKVVIDAMNPLTVVPGKPPVLAVGHMQSAGELVQKWLPAARVVKAFNTITSGLMVDPDLPGGPPDMFICGDDAAAKKVVSNVLMSFGWPAIDIGGIEGARLLEPLAMLGVVAGFQLKSWNHAFKLLRG